GLTAYGTGVLQAGVLRAPRLLAPLAGLIGGLAAGIMFVMGGVLAGADLGFTNHTFALLGASAVYDAVLAPIVFVLTTRVLGEPRTAPAPWAR
ncbi:MAG: hypothetical protein JWL83_1311, partial [Actinomycetia bacterium]|nr:hypothetical protein [Actinomycetes bacterium]